MYFKYIMSEHSTEYGLIQKIVGELNAATPKEWAGFEYNFTAPQHATSLFLLRREYVPPQK